MTMFESAEKVLEFAIQKEQEAADFYLELAEKMAAGAMKQVFNDFAREEMKHKEKLIGVQKGKKLGNISNTITDLKIGDYLVDVEPAPDMTYQEALIVAMKKEKAAFKLYNDLANAVQDNDLKMLMLSLAQEEAKHKLRFELEYDERILTDN
ncbi:ferritin family protein [bacterium]|nr:ferritin family protein [bacterium]